MEDGPRCNGGKGDENGDGDKERRGGGRGQGSEKGTGSLSLSGLEMVLYDIICSSYVARKGEVVDRES